MTRYYHRCESCGQRAWAWKQRPSVGVLWTALIRYHVPRDDEAPITCEQCGGQPTITGFCGMAYWENHVLMSEEAPDA